MKNTKQSRTVRAYLESITRQTEHRKRSGAPQLVFTWRDTTNNSDAYLAFATDGGQYAKFARSQLQLLEVTVGQKPSEDPFSRDWGAFIGVELELDVIEPSRPGGRWLVTEYRPLPESANASDYPTAMPF